MHTENNPIMSIDISGIDKVNLLKCLWKHSKPAIFFEDFNVLPPDFDENEAQEAVKEYIDYFCGRLIKANLSGNDVEKRQYDRYDESYGEGSFLKCVELCKNSSSYISMITKFFKKCIELCKNAFS